MNVDLCFLYVNPFCNKRYKRFNFLILQWNCFQLKTRLGELEMFLKKVKPDIVSINEIKMSTENANFHLRFEGYSTLFKCREKNGDSGGGVALLINEKIKFEKVCF